MCQKTYYWLNHQVFTATTTTVCQIRFLFWVTWHWTSPTRNFHLGDNHQAAQGKRYAPVILLNSLHQPSTTTRRWQATNSLLSKGYKAQLPIRLLSECFFPGQPISKLKLWLSLFTVNSTDLIIGYWFFLIICRPVYCCGLLWIKSHHTFLVREKLLIKKKYSMQSSKALTMGRSKCLFITQQWELHSLLPNGRVDKEAYSWDLPKELTRVLSRKCMTKSHPTFLFQSEKNSQLFLFPVFMPQCSFIVG